MQDEVFDDVHHERVPPLGGEQHIQSVAEEKSSAVSVGDASRDRRRHAEGETLQREQTKTKGDRLPDGVPAETTRRS